MQHSSIYADLIYQATQTLAVSPTYARKLFHTDLNSGLYATLCDFNGSAITDFKTYIDVANAYLNTVSPKVAS